MTSDQATAPTGGVAAQEHPLPVVPERRLHPAYLVIAAGRSIRSMIPVIAIGVWGAPWWTLAVVGVIVVVTSVGGWRVRRYEVSKGVLRVRSGLFNRTVHTIPAARITAMEAHRGVVQRIFRVWSLKVQTPGDGERASVQLSCLTAARLEELRTALSVHHGTGPPPDAATPGRLAGHARRGRRRRPLPHRTRRRWCWQCSIPAPW